MKYHPHGSVLFATFSIEQGVLLLCNPLCEAIIKSCLARAQFMYPVKVVAFLIEGTHVHLVLVVNNPDDVPSFIGHFKTESAHALNSILGRKKRTIWCEGYDSPIVLTPLRTLLVLSYIYTNPAKDNLENSIDNYPGVSSWKMFRKGELKKSWKRLRRPYYQALTLDMHNLRGYTKEAERLLALAKKTHTFELSPDAWLDAFSIHDQEERKNLNQKLINRIRTVEEREQRRRAKQGKKVMGAEKLRHQPFDTTRLSKREGKKMWCLSEDRELRIQFIMFLKDLFAKARAIRERWKVGDYSLPYPLGLYPPCQPKLGEPLAAW